MTYLVAFFANLIFQHFDLLALSLGMWTLHMHLFPISAYAVTTTLSKLPILLAVRILTLPVQSSWHGLDLTHLTLNMLTTASQFTPRARSLHIRHTATARILGAGCTQGIRLQEQTRGFRWGLWSNLDDEISREIRHQQRMLKHQYSKQLNRRLSWDKHPFSEDSRHALKRIVKSYWLSSYPGGRVCDETPPTRHTYADTESGVRPGHNIEDVERGAMDHLMYGEEQEPMSSHQNRNRNRKRRRVRPSKYTMESIYDQPAEMEEYIIDPITNRKVAKQHPPSSSIIDGEDIPVKTFKDYRSQFASPDSVSEHADSVKPQAQPHRQSDEYSAGNGTPESKKTESEVFEYEADGSGFMRSTETESSSATVDPRYDDLLRYRPLQDAAVDENLASSVAGLSGKPEDLPRHKIAIDEAHGKFDDLQPPQENTDEFGYKSVVADEIASRVEGIERHDIDQMSSTTVEPDITSEAEPIDAELEQPIPDHHDGKPLGFREEFVKPEVLRRYRSSIDPLEPGDFPESTVEDLRAKYGSAELKQFTTVRSVEQGETSDPAADEVMDVQVGYEQRIAPEEELDVLLSGSETMEKLVSVKQGHGRIPNNFQFEAPEGIEDEAVSTSEAPSPLQPSLERLTSVKQGQGKQSNYREMLESLMSQHERISDAQDYEAIVSVQKAKAKNREAEVPQRKLTGNYMRDFPEEFEKSWTQTLSAMPVEAETSFETETQVEGESMEGGLEGGFGRPSASKIQPALDRLEIPQAAIDQDSHNAKELENAELVQNEQMSDGVQQDGIIFDVKDEMATATEAETSTIIGEEATQNASEELRGAFEESSSISENEPVLYKILAYDPTMQKVNMAETTSLVPDFTSALSPADALLRLSHPTKFFPHFASLEAEGFEIASGSGDVLVFRKVRQSKPEQVKETPSETATAASIEPSSSESPINPIDMTGRPRVASPASANFASPTGYVKYENLPETEASKLPPPPPPDRVAYNINLRREEPVYSGPKQKIHGEKKQRKSLGHRLLIGGVWVAGISYGLGVVSEYFTTGGMDGLGPQGL